MSMIDDAINGGLEPDFGVPRRTLKNLPNPTPNIDDEIIRTLTLNLLSEYQQLETPANPDLLKLHIEAFEDKISQLITDARVDELEALIEKIECERPDCTTDHSNLRKKYVTNRIKELKENKR